MSSGFGSAPAGGQAIETEYPRKTQLSSSPPLATRAALGIAVLPAGVAGRFILVGNAHPIEAGSTYESFPPLSGRGVCVSSLVSPWRVG